MDIRVHKKTEQIKGDYQRIVTHQEEVDTRDKNFGDNFSILFYFTMNFNCIVFNSLFMKVKFKSLLNL
jgi:hypothetical protein